MGPRPHLWIFANKNRVLSTKITSLYGSQTSPVDLCMLNREFRTRITSLSWFQLSCVVFACETASLGPELQVSIGPRPHLWFCAFKTVTLQPELQVCIGPSPHLLFCAFKTANLVPELQISMSPRPHLSFCVGKTAC